MQNTDFLNKVLVCLKKHSIECTPTGAPNPKTGDWYNYKLSGKNKMFHLKKTCNNYTIKLDKKCNSFDAANAIVETVSIRFSHSNSNEAKQLVHELHNIKSEYTTKLGLIHGIVD